jgi:hypothetical protein
MHFAQIVFSIGTQKLAAWVLRQPSHINVQNARKTLREFENRLMFGAEIVEISFAGPVGKTGFITNTVNERFVIVASS